RLPSSIFHLPSSPSKPEKPSYSAYTFRYNISPPPNSSAISYAM
ncbi:MAG: hypothetical protein ACI9CQ_004702, partial [Saprospiraceae bacterium]